MGCHSQLAQIYLRSIYASNCAASYSQQLLLRNKLLKQTMLFIHLLAVN